MISCHPRGRKKFRLAEDRTPPRWVNRAGVDAIEAIFCFETKTGRGSGVLRLVPTPGNPENFASWVLLTTLDEIKGHEEQIGARRPRGEEWSGGFGSENWMDIRARQAAYADREPAVVVIGGSQCGQGIAASLGVLGVDTLVIDKHERVGDAWRKRYHNLVLHNEVRGPHALHAFPCRTIPFTFHGTRSPTGLSFTLIPWRSTFGIPPSSQREVMTKRRIAGH